MHKKYQDRETSLSLPTATYLCYRVIQTTKRTIQQLSFYLSSHTRKGRWFTRRTYDHMWQINGDGAGRGILPLTHWEIRKFFTIKCAFKLQKNRPYGSKTEFNYKHSI
eukprot:1284962-Amphidinium_carterae.1